MQMVLSNHKPVSATQRIWHKHWCWCLHTNSFAMKYSTQNIHIMRLLGQAIVKKNYSGMQTHKKFSCEFMPAMLYEVGSQKQDQY